MKKFMLCFALFVLGISKSYACFYSGEQVSGMNKICYYDCVDGTKAITISSVALCPMSINYIPSEDEIELLPLEIAYNFCGFRNNSICVKN